jgi:ubiquinone/menaquinone biosynthesis C-methylase UbiE
MPSNAYTRAEMPSGTAKVLDERTLISSNANLLQVLHPGQKVLDVGCGSGVITVTRTLQWIANPGHVIKKMIPLLDKDGILCVLDSDNTKPNFQTHLSIWTTVAELRGKQLVTDGYITETQRIAAIEDYNKWSATDAKSMKLDLIATHARI